MLEMLRLKLSKISPHRQEVKSLPFHGNITGSSPVGGINIVNIKMSCSCRTLLFLLVVSASIIKVDARPMRLDHIYQHQCVFTRNIAQLIEYIYSKGYKCTLGEVFRTSAQARLYAATGKGIVNSNHCSRLAVDINLFSPTDEYLHDVKDYKQFGEYWEKLNPFNEWGGRWSNGDACHFEMD